MTRVAAIDCGTNSIRLLVADVDDSGRLTDVRREMRIVRLGEGVDHSGYLAPAALARTAAALREYAATVRDLRAEHVRMVATSATRDASNRGEFVELVVSELGVEPDVISGAEEAALSFAGAVSVLPDTSGALLVADIGGGSTELVRGGDGPLRSHSMDVGCVRMTERYLRHDPPSRGEINATVADVRAALADARREVPLDLPVTFVGVAGSVTTVAALALGLDANDSTAIHGARISAAQVADVTARLLAMPHAKRAELGVMHPGRVDVIGGGALVLRTLVEEIGVADVIASEHDILDGIALSLA